MKIGRAISDFVGFLMNPNRTPGAVAPGSTMLKQSPNPFDMFFSSPYPAGSQEERNAYANANRPQVAKPQVQANTANYGGASYPAPANTSFIPPAGGGATNVGGIPYSTPPISTSMIKYNLMLKPGVNPNPYSVPGAPNSPYVKTGIPTPTSNNGNVAAGSGGNNTTLPPQTKPNQTPQSLANEHQNIVSLIDQSQGQYNPDTSSYNYSPTKQTYAIGNPMGLGVAGGQGPTIGDVTPPNPLKSIPNQDTLAMSPISWQDVLFAKKNSDNGYA